ncbi:DUF2177 family protein [Acidocella aromatica]|uniref:Putative membrane protein n=1 Tax=Acidocella aromatica TaxID=1303579 RepID=A0A840VCN2_9PROT|nr:DUF2177 family protein [Acidocella aromatica]MBB5373434.1 putative membrane protein [Acidocella aromatica]
MKLILTAYISTALTFLGLDAVWLSTMSARLYKPALQGLLAENFRPVPALLFYALYIGGVVAFAVLPSDKPGMALLRGAGLGLVAYATYDLTNQATLRRWSVLVTSADLAWGSLATGIAAAIACAICSALAKP